MAVVDSLEVEIQAKAKQANKEIDVLCSKLLILTIEYKILMVETNG